MFLECWLKIGFLLLDCLKFIQTVRLIATHSLSIARYSPPPQSLPFINATTKICYFPLIFFFLTSLLMYKIYDSWPSQNLLEGCLKRVSLFSLWISVKTIEKDENFQSNIIGLLFTYCCNIGPSAHAADTINYQGMIYNLLVNLSNICEIFTITKSVLLLTIMYNILSFKSMDGFFFNIIVTKVHISFIFSFSFRSLIWNSDGFVSINDLCNFNALV